MNNLFKMKNKIMAFICLIIAIYGAFSPLFIENPYMFEKTIILVLGLIGFALYQIAENTKGGSSKAESGRAETYGLASSEAVKNR